MILATLILLIRSVVRIFRPVYLSETLWIMFFNSQIIHFRSFSAIFRSNTRNEHLKINMSNWKAKKIKETNHNQNVQYQLCINCVNHGRVGISLCGSSTENGVMEVENPLKSLLFPVHQKPICSCHHLSRESNNICLNLK